jgi:DNA-binding response OmpR family regulator
VVQWAASGQGVRDAEWRREGLRGELEGVAMAKKVLVVDDEPPTVTAVELALQSEGIEVCTAADGAECLQAVATESPDLVILDVAMPVMDGFQALRVLRENAATKHLPVIMLTARDDDADIVRGWTTGVDFYLTKPFELDELLLVVRRALEATDTNSSDDASTDEPSP